MRAIARTVLTIGVIGISTAHAGAAQSASGASTSGGAFTGVVTRDTLGNPVSGAEIALPGLRRTFQTNERGEFRFADVPIGRYLVTIRAIGFSPFADSVSIAAGHTLDADLTLTPSTALLDTLHTIATRSTIETRSLEEFEARRKAHISGAFISDSALRANDESKMSSLIALLPGVHAVMARSSAVYIASGRAKTDGRPVFYASSGPSDFAGVEYYASPSTAPLQYGATGSDCGVLLLWSRKDRIAAP